MITDEHLPPPINPKPAAATLSEPKPPTNQGMYCEVCGHPKATHDNGQMGHPFSEPKPETQSLENEAPVASKAGDAPPQNTLRPCPFCGGTNIEISPPHSGQPLHYVAICVNAAGSFGCGASGNWELSRKDAIRKWNQRVAPSVVEGVEEKRWTEKGCGVYEIENEAVERLVAVAESPLEAAKFSAAHNASLELPRGERAAAHVLQNARLIEALQDARSTFMNLGIDDNTPRGLQLRKASGRITDLLNEISVGPGNAVLPHPVSKSLVPSLSEPKESEEEKKSLGEPGAI